MKKNAVIAVLLVLLLLALGAGGWFAWKYFSGDNAADAGEETQEEPTEKKKKKDGPAGEEAEGADRPADVTAEPTEAPFGSPSEAPAQTASVTLHGVTVPIPEGYTLSVTEDDYYQYNAPNGQDRLLIAFAELDSVGITENDSMTDILKKTVAATPNSGNFEIGEIREYKCGGGRAAAGLITDPAGTDGVDIMLVEVEDGYVVVAFFYSDLASTENRPTAQSTFGKVTAE